MHRREWEREMHFQEFQADKFLPNSPSVGEDGAKKHYTFVQLCRLSTMQGLFNQMYISYTSQNKNI